MGRPLERRAGPPSTSSATSSALLDELCAAEGRDRKEITVSVLLFERDPARMAEKAAAFAEAGADMAIVRPEQPRGRRCSNPSPWPSNHSCR